MSRVKTGHSVRFFITDEGRIVIVSETVNGKPYTPGQDRVTDAAAILHRELLYQKAEKQRYHLINRKLSNFN